MVAFKTVCDAFAEIEMRDLRVGRIIMPFEHMEHILPRIMDLRSTYLRSSAFNKRDTASKPVYAGELFGASLYVGGDRTLLGPEEEFSHACPTVEVDNFGVKAAFDVQRVYDVEVLGGSLEKGYIAYKNRISGLVIHVKTHCDPVWPCGHEEKIALEALREVITEEEYKRYLRTGFLSVRAASGLVYQIRRGRPHIRVWDGNRKVEEICTYIFDKEVPPTDGVLAFKTIVETDEAELRKIGNVYNFKSSAVAAA